MCEALVWGCGAEAPWRCPHPETDTFGVSRAGLQGLCQPPWLLTAAVKSSCLPFCGPRTSPPVQVVVCSSPAQAGGLSCGRGALASRGSVLGGSLFQYDVIVNVIKNTFLF